MSRRVSIETPNIASSWPTYDLIDRARRLRRQVTSHSWQPRRSIILQEYTVTSIPIAPVLVDVFVAVHLVHEFLCLLITVYLTQMTYDCVK